LRLSFEHYSKNRDFNEALSGFLLPDAASQGRRNLLQSRLVALSTP
jgi:hypothetical protein